MARCNTLVCPYLVSGPYAYEVIMMYACRELTTERRREREREREKETRIGTKIHRDKD